VTASPRGINLSELSWVSDMVSFLACQRARLAAPQEKATISELAPTGATVGLKHPRYARKVN
jgi:hypothetical protein